jgi:uncharacterized delta-60 repeat protein
VALQSGGRIVEAGYVDLSPTNVAWALARFTRSGALDTSFGNGGLVVTDWTPGDDEAWGLVVLGNDKIVAAGFAGGSFAAARYTPSGHLDHTFGGGDGKVTVNFTPAKDAAWDLAKAPGGKLVLVGQAGPAAHPVVAVARLSADGTLDHAFSGDGKATEDLGPSYGWDGIVLGDGSVIVTGNANGGTFAEVMITKFTSAGKVDGSFGDSGSWIAAAPNDAFANAVVRMASGKYMVGASVGNGTGSYDVGLFRFDANGHEDGTFGTQGLVIRDFGGRELVTDMKRTGSKLVIALNWTGQGGVTDQIGVARVLSSGSPDAGFGHQGLAVSTLPEAGGETMVVQGDGKILAGGDSRTTKDRFAVARFLAA